MKLALQKDVIAFRVDRFKANAYKRQAAHLGITISELMNRLIAEPDERFLIEVAKAIPTIERAVIEPAHDQGASGEYHNSPPIVEAKGDPKLTARYMFDQYKAEKDIPAKFFLAWEAGIIPLSWFTARHGFPDPSHIDAFEEFLAVDDPSAFGLNELAWEFIEE